MIRFACPRCQSQFDVPDTAAGTKIACPKCQQRLQVPVPPPNKTVLANLVGHQPAPPVASILPAAGISFAQPVPQPPPVAQIVPSPPAPLPSPSSGGNTQEAGRSRRRPMFVVLSVLAIILVVSLYLRGLTVAATPNARCPQCLTSCHIRSLEKMTFHQRAAKRHRCPFCGNVDDVHTFAEVWNYMR